MVSVERGRAFLLMPLWCSTLSYLKFFNRQKQTIIINKKMKKLTVVAMLAIAAATFTACGNSSPKAEMKNDIDSLSYAIGLEQSQGVRQYLEQMNIDTAYIDEFVKGLNAGALSQDDKRKAAYNAGVAIGMQTAMMTKGINRQLFGEDSTKTISLRNFLARLCCRCNRQEPEDGSYASPHHRADKGSSYPVARLPRKSMARTRK